jgi:hypothetical protein
MGLEGQNLSGQVVMQSRREYERAKARILEYCAAFFLLLMSTPTHVSGVSPPGAPSR